MARPARQVQFDQYATRAQVLYQAMQSFEFWQREASGLNFSFFDKRRGLPTGKTPRSFISCARSAIKSQRDRTQRYIESMAEHAQRMAELEAASPADKIRWQIHCMEVSNPIYNKPDIDRLTKLLAEMEVAA